MQRARRCGCRVRASVGRTPGHNSRLGPARDTEPGAQMTASAIVEAQQAVTRQHAGELLGVGGRQLRKLISRGSLVGIGKGPEMRITLASLTAELINRKKVERPEPKKGTRRESVPLLCSPCIDTDDEPAQTQTMYSTLPGGLNVRDPIGRLLSLSQASLLVGLSEKLLKREISAVM
jgi:hypothetical protein